MYSAANSFFQWDGIAVCSVHGNFTDTDEECFDVTFMLYCAMYIYEYIYIYISSYGNTRNFATCIPSEYKFKTLETGTGKK
jgi:hypothetical protein